MSIISKILQQELNDNQSKNTTAETNATPNNVQLILSYFAEADLGLLQHPSWKALTIITKRFILDVAM